MRLDGSKGRVYVHSCIRAFVPRYLLPVNVSRYESTNAQTHEYTIL